MTTVDISQLDPAARRELYDQLAYEFGRSKRGAGNTYTPEETDLWSTLCDVLDEKGRPLARFLESFGASKYREAVEQVNGFISRGCGQVMRRPVRLAVMRVVLACLVSHLRARAIPQSPAVMLNSLVMLQHAVDQRFPGYVQAKLLHRVAPLQVA